MQKYYTTDIIKNQGVGGMSRDIKQEQVENTIKLIDEGNTIPFIARYRKEVTGYMDCSIYDWWRIQP